MASPHWVRVRAMTAAWSAPSKLTERCSATGLAALCVDKHVADGLVLHRPISRTLWRDGACIHDEERSLG